MSDDDFSGSDPFNDEDDQEELDERLEELGEPSADAVDDEPEEKEKAAAPAAKAEPEAEEEEPEDEPTRDEKRDSAMRILREKAEAQEKRASRTEQRLALLLKAVHGDPADEEEREALEAIPDFDDDPKGHIYGVMALERAKKERDQEIKDGAAQLEEVESTREEIEEFLIEDRAAALREHDDFAEAETFLAERIVEGYLFQNPAWDQKRAFEEFQQEWIAPMYAKYGLARKSLSGAIYEAAKRNGFKSENGDAPKSRRRGKSRVRERAKLQRGAKSLAAGGGGAVRKTVPSAKEASEMSDDDFSDLLETIGEKGFRELATELAEFSE